MNSFLTKLQTRLCKEYDNEQALRLALALCSLRRDELAMEKLCTGLSGIPYSEALNRVSQKNIERWQQLYKNKKTVAAYFYFSVICNQMTYIAEAFENSEYAFTSIANLEHLTANNSTRIADFIDTNFLALPGEQWLEKIDPLSAIFLPEFNERSHWPLPKQTLRIGCAHGIDVPVAHTLNTYGGGHLFDVVLSPTNHSRLPENYLLNRLPRELVDHHRECVTIIPFGSPKLDKLHRLSRNDTQPPNRIIYHLSNWELESPHLKKNLAVNLRTIAAHFSHHNLLFRPFPNDLKRPEIIATLKAVSDVENISVSVSPSYVEDYQSAVFMITHRQQTGHNFALATGRPIFWVTDREHEIEYEETDFGFKVAGIENLIQRANAYLEGHLSPQRLIHKCNRIANRGCATAVFLKNFDALLQGKTLPHWQRLPLYDESTGLSTPQSIVSALEEKRAGPFSYIPLALAATAAHPQHTDILLLCAKAYAKTPNPEQQPFYYHYWQQSLLFLARAISAAPPEKHHAGIKQWLENRALMMLESLGKVGSKFSNNPELDRSVSIIKAYQSRFQIEPRIQAPVDVNVNQALLLKIAGASRSGIINLFGASELAESIIRVNNQSSVLNIRGVYDSNPDKRGLCIAGRSIESITGCSDASDPFVVCSIAHSQDMESYLFKTFGDTTPTITLQSLLT